MRGSDIGRQFRKRSAWRSTDRLLVAQFPLVDEGGRRGARHYLGSPGLASLEVESACEVLFVAPAAARWPSPRSPPSTCFQAAAGIPVELPSPEPASSRFILPWQFLLLRVPSLKSPARCLSTRAHLPRVSSLIAASLGARPLLTKVAKPSLRSVLRFSQPLDGFLRAPALRACSIPQPRPGLSPFRGFSPRAARRLHQAPLPPCRCPPARCPALAHRVRFRDTLRDRRAPRS
jgi:hypothetical protein